MLKSTTCSASYFGTQCPLQCMAMTVILLLKTVLTAGLSLAMPAFLLGCPRASRFRLSFEWELGSSTFFSQSRVGRGPKRHSYFFDPSISVCLLTQKNQLQSQYHCHHPMWQNKVIFSVTVVMSGLCGSKTLQRLLSMCYLIYLFICLCILQRNAVFSAGLFKTDMQQNKRIEAFFLAQKSHRLVLDEVQLIYILTIVS